MTEYRLIMGNKNYSSWSLRAWLMLKLAGADFEETTVLLGRPDSQAKLRQLSPTGLVPVLMHGGLAVPESIAIAEYLAERHPGAGLWPDDPRARAHARAVAAQMHAGFFGLRNEMPMNLTHRTDRIQPSDHAWEDIARMQALWRQCRRDFGGDGPFLFGRAGIADAMYAPVATRFRTYGIAVDDDTADYMEAIFALPAMREAFILAAQEPRIPEYDL